ncbi:MAG: hypothetical protein LKJ47_04195 [Bifidobacteriaceae bacterium]|jgi:hypothetical protein|nr:hypothetical protein [Bifidobacteriaceae bacterium]
MRNQLMSMGIFYGIYLACAWLLPMIILLAAVPDDHTGTTDIIIATAIYAIITSAMVLNKDFKLLVQFGFSRTRIFSIAVAKSFISSLTIAALTTFLEWSLPFIVISGSNVRLQLLGVGIYADGEFIMSHYMASDHYGMIFVLTFFLIFMMSALGVLFSLLFDRLETVGRLVLAACCVAVPFAIVAIHNYLLTGEVRAQFGTFFRTIAGVDFPYFHAGPIIGTMLALTTVFFGITFLLNRRREIKRVNA